jgi:hypothetical protein
MRDVFNRHADCSSNQALSAPALMAALNEVEAPVFTPPAPPKKTYTYHQAAATAALLTREEVISIVMYSGPAFVFYNAALRRFPADIGEVFKAADNQFLTTILVLVSAINKLSRCAKIPTGFLLYRGLGGTLEFPERLTLPDPSPLAQSRFTQHVHW